MPTARWTRAAASVSGGLGLRRRNIRSPLSAKWSPATLVTGEFKNRRETAALAFRLSPWTCANASPAIRLGRHHSRLMPAALRGVSTPQSRVHPAPPRGLARGLWESKPAPHAPPPDTLRAIVFDMEDLLAQGLCLADALISFAEGRGRRLGSSPIRSISS